MSQLITAQKTWVIVSLALNQNVMPAHWKYISTQISCIHHSQYHHFCHKYSWQLQSISVVIYETKIILSEKNVSTYSATNHLIMLWFQTVRLSWHIQSLWIIAIIEIRVISMCIGQYLICKTFNEKSGAPLIDWTSLFRHFLIDYPHHLLIITIMTITPIHKVVQAHKPLPIYTTLSKQPLNTSSKWCLFPLCYID